MKKQIEPRFVEVHPGMQEQMEETLRLVRALAEHVLKRDPSLLLKRRPARLRALKCTQQLFEMLPGIVSREEFLDWTGLDGHELRDEILAGRISVYKPDPHGYARYYKHEIARLTNWKM